MEVKNEPGGAKSCVYTPLQTLFGPVTLYFHIKQVFPFLVVGKPQLYKSFFFLVGFYKKLCFLGTFVQKTTQQSNSCCYAEINFQFLHTLFVKIFLFVRRRIKNRNVFNECCNSHFKVKTCFLLNCKYHKIAFGDIG